MKRKPSLAVAVSFVALFFSLTGAGFAASRYIITSKSQIKPSVLHALTGPQGLQGVQGSPGPIGPQGPAGAPSQDTTPLITAHGLGIARLYVRSSASMPLSQGQATQPIWLDCDQGDRVLSGGFTGQNETVTTEQIVSDYAPATWFLAAHLETGATDGNVSAWVLCITNN